MYSSQGLADWELLFVSGTLAVGMLVVSALIGWTIAYLALREPAPTARTATKTVAVPVAVIPQHSESVAEPAYSGERRGLAVSSR